MWKSLSSWGHRARGRRMTATVGSSVLGETGGSQVCSHGYGEGLQLPNPPCPSSLNHNPL